MTKPTPFPPPTPVEIEGGALPANGTEGDDFRYVYCSHCHHDHRFSHVDENEADADAGCPLMLAALLAEHGEPGPEQWQRRHGPHFLTIHCTAFQPCQICR